jgi:hypothetical protein
MRHWLSGQCACSAGVDGRVSIAAIRLFTARCQGVASRTASWIVPSPFSTQRWFLLLVLHVLSTTAAPGVRAASMRRHEITEDLIEDAARRVVEPFLEIAEIRQADHAPEISVIGPRLHQALSHVAGSGRPADEIVGEFARGYMVADRVLRPALVAVSASSGASPHSVSAHFARSSNSRCASGSMNR